MGNSFLSSFLLLSCGLSLATATIVKDVAIIGGGASGTYAAVNLRDQGSSVVVVEKEAVLGGHTRSYKVPGTDISLEVGVHGFTESTALRKFFSHFNIGLQENNAPRGSTVFADFSTGKNASLLIPPTPDFSVYSEQLDKYPYLTTTIDLPNPVPSDLYLPFGDFVEKYGLQDEVFAIYYTAQGLGDLLKLPTLYVLQYMDAGFTALAQGAGKTFIPVGVDNQEIFRRAQTELGSDVLLSSTVTSATRSSSGITLTVKSPSGTQTIKAKKLLISIKPTIQNMKPFGLDATESGLFSQFGFTGWYVALVNNTGFAAGTSYQNVDLDRPYNLAALPSVYSFTPTQAPGVYWVRYGSTTEISASQVQNEILDTITRLRPLGGNTVTGSPKILAYASHTPFQLTVSPNAIRDGFYGNLSDLQGHKNTWYTGETFITPHFSSVLDHADGLVSQLS